MGEDGPHRRAGGGGRTLSPVRARVVPAVPSFGVDQGFRYAVPAELEKAVREGSIVRVPLGGRRVRGFVVEVEAVDDVAGLKPIAAVSGRQPIFDGALADTLRWAAHHYVSPLSVLLERAAPPNNPPPTPAVAAPLPEPAGEGLEAVVEAAVADRMSRPTVMLSGAPPVRRVLATAIRLLRAGRSTMIVVPTAAEAQATFGAVAEDAAGHAVIAHGEMTAAALTKAWARSTAPCVLVGTPRVTTWAVARLGAAFVIEDGRRAMKDRQTPTVHARDVLRHRSQRERFGLVVTGPVPTTEILATGPLLVRSTPGRIWPLVEVVDRRHETTGGSLLTDPVRRALAAVTRRKGRSFVFGHRHGYAAATRCGACKTVRRCPGCGSRPDPGDECTRCGTPLGPCVECGGRRFEPLGAGVGRLVAEVGRIVGSHSVRPAPDEARVVVGTERDVIGMTGLELAVIPDFDGLLFGTNYRAAEDALRLAARIAGLVGRGSGHRMMIQTSAPDHAVVRALVKGDPVPALEAELEERAALAYPPSGELAVIEISGGPRPDLSSLAAVCDVLGPADRNGTTRWLIQAPDLSRARTELRTLVQHWRDGSLTVRIDVDPIDL